MVGICQTPAASNVAFRATDGRTDETGDDVCPAILTRISARASVAIRTSIRENTYF
jgi:hypothetical protein